jgi:two-component system osmolarity sensor histidine kinase EnvZ
MSDSNPSSAHPALMQLLGRVSHDLRGPAGITSGVLDELESRDAAAADAALFAMARRGLAGILRIAERLEMVAQLDAGPLHVERLPIDLSALVTRASDDAKIIQKRKAITVTLDLASEIKANVDQRWFSVTVMEVIANAIRHAKSSVRVTASYADGKHLIVVEDDGRGFTEDALASLTEPRFSRSSARAGLGLSLSIARDTVRAHGGEIRLLEASGEGARVEIEFSDS